MENIDDTLYELLENMSVEEFAELVGVNDWED